MGTRSTALFAMNAEHVPHLFPPDVLRRLQKLVDIDCGLIAEDLTDPRVRPALARADYLLTGWGCPPVTAAVLAGAPRLRAVLHAAGSVKGHITDACWQRGLLVSSAASANALPVAEYALAAVLFAGKDVFRLSDAYRARGSFAVAEVIPGVGNHGQVVGVVGASRIGRRLLELLTPFDVEVLLHDPYVDAARARALGARSAGLDELLRASDTVTLHAPLTPATTRMIGAVELARLRDGATLVNTARGGLVDHDALLAELRSGRISAVLDVTDPEPLPADSPLFGLPNVFLTPHVAGSQGNEVARLGAAAVDELERLLAGRPLAHPVTRDDLERVA